MLKIGYQGEKVRTSFGKGPPERLFRDLDAGNQHVLQNYLNQGAVVDAQTGYITPGCMTEIYKQTDGRLGAHFTEGTLRYLNHSEGYANIFHFDRVSIMNLPVCDVLHKAGSDHEQNFKNLEDFGTNFFS